MNQLLATLMNKMHECSVVFIFARGGSKGLPNKNIKNLNGKPLIAYSIDLAKKLKFVNDIIISTDSEKIAKVAKDYGANVPFMRPDYLAQDDSNELDAWKHAILEYERIFNKKIDNFISLPPTAPLRSLEDIKNCFLQFKKNKSNIIVTVKNSKNNPYFNMIEKKSKHSFKLVSDIGQIIRRQSAPKVYDMTTVAYIAKRDYLLETKSLLDGKFDAFVVPEERAIDIDNEIDFMIAEMLLLNRNKLRK